MDGQGSELPGLFMIAEVQGLQDRLAVLKLEDGQIVNWPKARLPQGVAEGSKIRIFVSTSLTEEEERAKLARNLLNEILKPS